MQQIQTSVFHSRHNCCVVAFSIPATDIEFASPVQMRRVAKFATEFPTFPNFSWCPTIMLSS